MRRFFRLLFSLIKAVVVILFLGGITYYCIDKIQKKVDINQRFVIGVTAVLTTLVAVLQVVPPIIKVLTPPVTARTIERTI